MPIATRSARGSRCKTDAGVQQRELTIGGGHASGELVPLHFGLGQSRDGPGARHLARRHAGRLAAGDSNQTYLISQARHRAVETASERRAHGSARLGRPAATSACRTREPELPAGDLRRSASSGCASAWTARLRPRRRLRRSRAQRQHLVPDRLRPALRGGAADRWPRRRSGRPGRQRELGHGRCRATADAAPPVPGLQPAQPAARSVPAAGRDPRRRGHRARKRGSGSSAGRPTRSRG